MGGAMDLVSSVRNIVVLMTMADKKGGMKFKKTIELPATGVNCISKLITECCVFEFDRSDPAKVKVILKEISKNSSLEKVRSMTDVDFIVAEPL